MKIAINGFGRIGRLVFRAGYKDPKIEFVAINDIGDPKTLLYLLKNDSVHGKFKENIELDGNNFLIGNKKIKILSDINLETPIWKEFDVDLVIECTGQFRTKELLEKHIKAGAKKVLLSAPAKDDMKTIVMGVNDDEYDKKDTFISNASCTTNCLAPIAKILNDNLKIKSGFMVTVHASTNDQRLLDGVHKDLRRARGVFSNIIPTSSGATTDVIKTIPSLKGKLEGYSLRVPIEDVSIVDFVCYVEKETNVEEVNKLFYKAAKGPLKGILEYSDEHLVSSDILENPSSSVFDSRLTKINGKMVKVASWYDNEWGYSNRLIDVAKLMAD